MPRAGASSCWGGLGSAGYAATVVSLVVACNNLVPAASVWVESQHAARADGGEPGLGMAWRMSKFMTWCAGLVLFGALAGCGQPAAAGAWGRAVVVPGPGGLNKGAGRNLITGVWSVSCASAGSCAAGGDYQDGDRHGQGSVAVERDGVWGRAVQVPGLGALNKGGDAAVVSVSCASPGNCAAGGYYTAGDARQPGFVVSEKNGRWGKAVEVPGLAARNTGGDASVGTVSCALAGSCAAAGSYTGRRGRSQGFVVSQTGQGG